MAEVKVVDITPCGTDAVGKQIEALFAKVVPLYAVYRTRERGMIHLADAPVERGRQRTLLSPLNPLRGEINGLIDGWRCSTKRRILARAHRFDRRVADALSMALENDRCGAREILEKVKQDIISERTSWARFLYLMIASAAAMAIMLLACLATSSAVVRTLFDFGAAGNRLWLGAGVGTVGAFFSIAIAIRSRTILTDLRLRDNAADAVLRIVVGAIAGALILLIILSGAVGLSIGTTTLTPATVLAPANTMLAMLIAFAAGFSERLVSDLLVRATPAELAAAAPRPAVPGSAAAAAARPAVPAS